MGWWRPRGFTLDNFSSEDDVPYISTPRSWPIWTAAVPTPPATAWIRTRGVRGRVGVFDCGAAVSDCEAALRSDGRGARPHTGSCPCMGAEACVRPDCQ